jgi:hypothetical protein
MSAQIAQRFAAIDRRSNGSHRVSLVYNAASNPNPNPIPSSHSPSSPLSPLVPLLSSRLTHPPPLDPPPLLPLSPADPPIATQPSQPASRRPRSPAPPPQATGRRPPPDPASELCLRTRDEERWARAALEPNNPNREELDPCGRRTPPHNGVPLQGTDPRNPNPLAPVSRRPPALTRLPLLSCRTRASCRRTGIGGSTGRRRSTRRRCRC